MTEHVRVAVQLTAEQARVISELLNALSTYVPGGLNLLGEWTPEAAELWAQCQEAQGWLVGG